MNTTDLLTSWSTLSLEEIEAELSKESQARAARKLYGARAVHQMRHPPAAARAIRALPRVREAVVLLPGIMGPQLSSIRGVTDLLWINPVIFLQGHANYLDMNADATGDATPSVEVVPVGIEKLVYLKFSLALRRETELYEFPYDWRRPVEANADVLHACLERWAAGEAGKRFTLVGHSMGGVVSRAYLARHPADAERRIKRVVSLGTPYFGAANAIENIVLGNEMMAVAAKLNAGNQTKRLLMNMPSLYELLPAPPDLFPAGRAYPANWDLYNAAAWQFAGIRADYLELGRKFHAPARSHESPGRNHPDRRLQHGDDSGCPPHLRSRRAGAVRARPTGSRARCRRRHGAAVVGRAARARHCITSRSATATCPTTRRSSRRCSSWFMGARPICPL